MTRNQSSLTPLETQLLAILEADGGWMDRAMLAYRYPNAKSLNRLHFDALHHLVDLGYVEVEKRPGPRGYPHRYYRLKARP